ncbi:MAG: septum formation protein Maf [Deltaproteobacteria bacterium]|nr:septum formation protein Maf [Deltaproteobacteria bacterium]
MSAGGAPVSRPLVLASGSPIRRALLAQAGYAFEVLPADIAEPQPHNVPPAELAAALALAKAHAVAAQRPGAVVVGADQVLLLPDGTAAGKPWDRAAARAQLRALAGRRHALVSAAAVVADGAEELVVDRVDLTLRALSDAELERVLDWDEWRGNAGSYRMESRGVHLVDTLQGDHFTVLGLPLLGLVGVLRRLGAGPLA